MGRVNPKILKLKKQMKEHVPTPKVETSLDARIFSDKFRPVKEGFIHKKFRTASFEARNSVHGGSYAMARHGGKALLEHPYFPDPKVRNRNLRYSGHQVVSTEEGVNYQEKLRLKGGRAEYLYCIARSADMTVQLFLFVPTEDDPNFRIIEVTKLGVKRSLGYNSSERALNKLTSGEIQWLKN